MKTLFILLIVLACLGCVSAFSLTFNGGPNFYVFRNPFYYFSTTTTLPTVSTTTTTLPTTTTTIEQPNKFNPYAVIPSYIQKKRNMTVTQTTHEGYYFD